jgi:very-short-patch-repair endonuclease
MPQPSETIRKARKLRRTMTLPEVLIWQHLRASPSGIKFRRQYPIGPYVLDFYCPSARTGIEIDGSAHDMGANPARDVKRDAWLVAQGITVRRFSAREVLGDVGRVVDSILRACR